MMERFTDSAREALQSGFAQQPVVPERDVIAGLMAVRSGVAYRMLSRAGITEFNLWSGPPFVEWRELIEQATAEAEKQGVDFVGTEHLLLALARQKESSLTGLGASADRLGELLTAIEDERHKARPPWVARRIGMWCRIAFRWAAGQRA
jgi:hypothetical protein